MQCLRCGYCCCFLDVIIISSSALQKTGEVDFTNETNFQHKPCDKECPHLKWDNENAVCIIHSCSWFEETPCHEYGQIESKDSPCRMGQYLKDNNIDVRERLKQMEAINGRIKLEAINERLR